jgi:hypothetical protein
MPLYRTLALVLAAGLLVTLGRAEDQPKKKNAIPAEARAILDKADSFELLSLDPSPEGEVKDGFHDWKVLGKTEVKDAETRKKLVSALAKGAEENDGTVANCFNPRHGIRATHGKKTVELVICFECLQVKGYVDKGDKETANFLTAKMPQPVFDKVLKDAGVKLPKAAKE